MKKVHDMVLPTNYAEGVPRVLMEAASMGLPLIANDVPGCREVIHHGINGFLLKPNKFDELVSFTLQLINNSVLRQNFGNESIKIAKELFDINLVADQYSNVFDSYFTHK